MFACSFTIITNEFEGIFFERDFLDVGEVRRSDKVKLLCEHELQVLDTFVLLHSHQSVCVCVRGEETEECNFKAPTKQTDRREETRRERCECMYVCAGVSWIFTNYENTPLPPSIYYSKCRGMMQPCFLTFLVSRISGEHEDMVKGLKRIHINRYLKMRERERENTWADVAMMALLEPSWTWTRDLICKVNNRTYFVTYYCLAICRRFYLKFITCKWSF